MNKSKNRFTKSLENKQNNSKFEKSPISYTRSMIPMKQNEVEIWLCIGNRMIRVVT